MTLFQTEKLGVLSLRNTNLPRGITLDNRAVDGADERGAMSA